MADIFAELKTEPALAYKLAVTIPGGDPDSPQARRAARTVRGSPLVATLFENRDTTGRSYRKWIGAHWVLSILADLGCPPGDDSLRPLMDETFGTWLSAAHQKNVRLIAGRTRRCASQEGYAIWCSLKLGFADARTDELVARLLRWQWLDGGWNCDKHPEANKSSFMETLIPLRALSLYARVTGDPAVRAASERAAEVFLKRHLFRRQTNGNVMNSNFVLLHYPAYWHYDILFGLKVMAEAGYLSDPRCREALDRLASKRLPDGGFPAEATYSRPTRSQLAGYTPVTWGGVSRKEMNPFVTADALFVLHAAGLE